MSFTTYSNQLDSDVNVDSISSSPNINPDRNTIDALIEDCLDPLVVDPTTTLPFGVSIEVPVGTLRQWFQYNSDGEFIVNIPTNGTAVTMSSVLDTDVDPIVERLISPLRDALLGTETIHDPDVPLGARYDFYLKSVRTRIKSELKALDIRGPLALNNQAATFNIQNASAQLATSLADRGRIVEAGGDFINAGDIIMFKLTLKSTEGSVAEPVENPDVDNRDGTENAVTVPDLTLKVTLVASA